MSEGKSRAVDPMVIVSMSHPCLVFYPDSNGGFDPDQKPVHLDLLGKSAAKRKHSAHFFIKRILFWG